MSDNAQPWDVAEFKTGDKIRIKDPNGVPRDYTVTDVRRSRFGAFFEYDLADPDSDGSVTDPL